MRLCVLQRERERKRERERERVREIERERERERDERKRERERESESERALREKKGKFRSKRGETSSSNVINRFKNYVFFALSNCLEQFRAMYHLS